MTDRAPDITAEVEAHRARLRAVAYRLLADPQVIASLDLEPA